MRLKAVMGCLGCALLLALAAAPAQASRALEDEALLTMDRKFKLPPPEAQIEGACGLAVGSSGQLYVSDYHHRVVDLFNTAGTYSSQITGVGTAPEGPCGLALSSGGALYVNIWHQSVVRLTPSRQVFDTANSTGVAVDETGDVYVNDRTYVAVYEPSGALLMKVGEGSLGDGFGVAAFDGKVYVPDAADDTVKVYEPAVDLVDPVFEIDGSGTLPGEFVSLVDASAAIDPTNGHLLVVDNLKPGYERPRAAIYEFDSSGALLGQLPGPLDGPVHGGPSGIAVDPVSGAAYVTDGNGEESNVYAYSPYHAFLAPEVPPEASASPSAAASGAALASQPGGAAAGAAAGRRAGHAQRSRKRHRKRTLRPRGVGVAAARALR